MHRNARPHLIGLEKGALGRYLQRGSHFFLGLLGFSNNKFPLKVDEHRQLFTVHNE